MRSAISARSSWATAPSTCSENMPCGVVVSIGSRRLRKCAPACLQLLDDGEQVADRARQAIEPDHYQGFAGSDLVQQARQHGPAAIGAGGVLFEDRGAASGAQFVELRIGALFLGGDPRIADQAADGGAFSGWLRWVTPVRHLLESGQDTGRAGTGGGR